MFTVRWPSGKAWVCKTHIRGFDSRPHLFYFPFYPAPAYGAFCLSAQNLNGTSLPYFWAKCLSQPVHPLFISSAKLFPTLLYDLLRTSWRLAGRQPFVNCTCTSLYSIKFFLLTPRKKGLFPLKIAPIFYPNKYKNRALYRARFRLSFQEVTPLLVELPAKWRPYSYPAV